MRPNPLNIFLFPIRPTRYLTPDGKLEPQLAESWTFAGGGRSRAELRSGVTFHDGAKFNADTVKANFERAKTDAKSTLSRLTQVDSVVAIDELTVRYNLNAPAGSLPRCSRIARA
jgi:peptide/nickel transport system substrate-binding protein